MMPLEWTVPTVDRFAVGTPETFDDVVASVPDLRAIDRAYHRDQAANYQRAIDASGPHADDLAQLLARRPELRGVGITEVLEGRWTA